MFLHNLSLTKPALGALGFFLSLVMPLLPIWTAILGWFGGQKDAMQGIYYAAMSLGFLWRSSVWLNRYLRRTHGCGMGGLLTRRVRHVFESVREWRVRRQLKK